VTPAELVEALSIQIYSPPLSEHRNSGRIADTSAPLSVAMLILDFDTEVTMNGINLFLGNSTGDYARETVTALEIIGCADAARLLREIIDIATTAGMTRDAICADRTNLAPYAVTSWRQTHGDKWEAASDKIWKCHKQIPYPAVLEQLELFVGRHQYVLEPLISAKS
jgi:hypothetical protein